MLDWTSLVIALKEHFNTSYLGDKNEAQMSLHRIKYVQQLAMLLFEIKENFTD